MEPKKIKILKSVLIKIRNQVLPKYKDFLMGRGISSKEIEEMPEGDIWEYELSDGKYAFDVALGVSIDKKYLTKSRITESKGKNSNSPEKDVYTYHIEAILGFIGFTEEMFEDRFKSFIKDLKDNERLPRGLIEDQEQLFVNSYSKFIDRPYELSEQYRKDVVNRFDGSVWKFYFRGYKLPKDKRDGLHWPLLQLIITFKKKKEKKKGDTGSTVNTESSKDFEVEIHNTRRTKASSEHYDYIGTSRLSESSRHVLVMNLRTKKLGTRQLNLKLSTPDALNDDVCYLGQYLNYDETGKIFSGSFMMEQVFEDFDRKAKAKAKVFWFPVDNDKKIEDESMQSLRFFFAEEHLNFRTTPKKISSREAFDEWVSKEILAKRT